MLIQPSPIAEISRPLPPRVRSFMVMAPVVIGIGHPVHCDIGVDRTGSRQVLGSGELAHARFAVGDRAAVTPAFRRPGAPRRVGGGESCIGSYVDRRDRTGS